MTKDVSRVMKWTWIACAIVVLVATLYLYDGTENSEADLLLAYGMLALSFPSSLLVVGAAGAIGRLVHEAYGFVLHTSYWSIAVTWMCFFSLGYVQWFRFVPWLVRRWKSLRLSRQELSK